MLPHPARPSTDRPTGAAPSRRRMLAVTGAAAALLLTGACGGGSAGAGSASSASASSAAPATTTAAGTSQAPELSVSDAWVKATEGAEDPGMTAAFGVLTNTTDRAVTVVSASTSASDRAELHEMAMVDGVMVMRPRSGGFAVPAGGSTTLEPGGEHVMIMDVADAIRPGDEVTVTLTLDDGGTVDFTALAKDFAGAQEEYAGTSGSAPAPPETPGAMGMSGATPSSAAQG